MTLQQKQTQFDLTITGALMEKCTTSFVASKRCVHIMVRTSLLNILYRRLPLDSSDLRTQHIENEPYMVFKRKIKSVNDPIIKFYIKWLKGIQDAIEKNYLKEVFLYLRSSTGNILESYRFKLKYNLEPDERYQTKPEPPEVKTKIINLLKVIHTLGGIDKLEKGSNVQLEFTYNEDTPSEYEPPGFEPVNGGPAFYQTGQPNALLGEFNTGYHKFNLFSDNRLLQKYQALTGADDLSQSQTVNAETEAALPVDNLCIPEEHEDPQEDLQPAEKATKEGHYIAKIDDKSNRLNISNITLAESIDDIISISSEDDCMCQLNLPDLEILKCSLCSIKFHAICQGYMDMSDEAKKDFQCHTCSGSDKKLIALPEMKKHAIAKIRLLLWYILKNDKRSDIIMEQFAMNDRDEIFSVINDCQLYRIDGSVNKDVLDGLIRLMFNNFGPDSQVLE